MSPQSLAKTLFPRAKASATQPRRKIQSPFTPLVGWLAALWASKGRKKAQKDRSLVPEPHHFTTPVTVHEEPTTPPIVHSTDSVGMTSRNDDGHSDYDASEMPFPLSQAFERGLTKEELDYVVDALLAYLEEGKAASPESGLEDYEYYAQERRPNVRRLRHGLWYVPSLWSLALFDAHPCS